MDLEYTISFMFAFHIALLIVKLWALNTLIRKLIISEAPNAENYLFVFKRGVLAMFILTLTIICAEFYLLFNYFAVDEVYLYEYLSMLDQIFLTMFLITTFSKEAKNGNKN
jgi:hypothetical protein